MHPRALALLMLGLPVFGSLVLACRGEPNAGEEIGGETGGGTETGDGTETGGGSDSSSETDSSGETDPSSETDDCIPTSLGCMCAEDQSCALGLACVEGICEFVDNCTPGTESCSCLDGGGCLDPYLTCWVGICEWICTPGYAGCPCLPSGCHDGLECISGECWMQSPYPNCGWDDTNDWFACGSRVVYPYSSVTCPEVVMLEVGASCLADPNNPNYGVGTTGCCDPSGNNWWCEAGVLAFDDCSP